MKKYLKVVAALVAVVAVLTACGGSSKPVEVDANALADSLLNDLSYEAEMKAMPAPVVGINFGIADDVEATVYVGSGDYVADMVAVFTAADANGAAEVLESVQSYLTDMQADFERYEPDQAARIDTAYTYVNDKYVVLVISADQDAAKGIVEGAFAQ